MACEEAPMLAGVLRNTAPRDPEELRRAAGTAAMFSAGRAVALARALEISAPTGELAAERGELPSESGK